MKITKRIIALMLIAIVVAVSIGCSKSDMAGKWTLTKMEQDGVDYMSFLSLLTEDEGSSLELGLELKNDGTATMNLGDDVEEGKWVQEGNAITLTPSDGEEGSLVLTLKDGKLTAEEDGMVMEFTKR